MSRRVRIGIDVGGTFTDAVALDFRTYEVLGHVKVPTTHGGKGGVAEGIILALHKLLEKYSIAPEHVSFIAHGTTQATNALLEGDVASVGIIGMGQGLQGYKARLDTRIGDIEVAPGKFIHTSHRFLDIKNWSRSKVMEAITKLLDEGAQVIVASEAFSVDDPQNEIAVMEVAQRLGVPATSSHEISKLYGLKARTRTAVINASILPRMMQTAELVDQAIKTAQVKAPLMVMRCDGGVMQLEEVRKRPILTILSGPAAGVAGALMYQKVSDGIFLEVGGTSTDISVIKNGRVQTAYAVIGSHRTYVSSLDVRTVGVAGGSMVRVEADKIVEVGPRSAHIAGAKYCAFAHERELAGAVPARVAPITGDPQYLVLKGEDGTLYAVTPTCAANFLGLVRPGEYAFGNQEAVRIAFSILARELKSEPGKVAEQILEKAAAKVVPVLKDFIKDYELNPAFITLTGGGGGAGAIVPFVARKMNFDYIIAQNAEVISPIGAAVAMVRETVERTIINPRREDILRIRKEAEEAVIRAGASPYTVEVFVETDAVNNIVRATGVGSTEMRRRDPCKKALSMDEIRELAGKALRGGDAEVELVARTSQLYVFTVKVARKGFMTILQGENSGIVVIDEEGVVRLQVRGGHAGQYSREHLLTYLEELVRQEASYDESGERPPNVYILKGARIIDFSGLPRCEQITTLARTELELMASGEEVVLITSPR